MRRARAAVQVIVLSLTAAASSNSQPPIRRASPHPKRSTAPSISYSAGTSRVTKNSTFDKLLPISLTNINTRKTVSLRLYDSSGVIDEQVAQKLDSLLCDARDHDDIHTRTIDRRLLQLVYRVAYHFSSDKVEVVSAYRKAIHKREGMHAQGRAIDFRLAGVTASVLPLICGRFRASGLASIRIPRPNSCTWMFAIRVFIGSMPLRRDVTGER
jgi:uncharacterized protein YcbK (DUF882 family)